MSDRLMLAYALAETDSLLRALRASSIERADVEQELEDAVVGYATRWAGESGDISGAVESARAYLTEHVEDLNVALGVPNGVLVSD